MEINEIPSPDHSPLSGPKRPLKPLDKPPDLPPLQPHELGEPNQPEILRVLEEQQALVAAQMAQAFPATYISPPDAEELRRVLVNLAKRKIEGLKLYEPLYEQERFHNSLAPMRIGRGSNRAGKTLMAAVEIARAVTGQDPTGKYPKENGRCFCVGKDLDHIGQVMWRKLGRAGAFKIIRDARTGAWRAFRPWEREDQTRERDSRLAPPLIPPRLIKSIAWESKKEGVPNLVVLTNGWEISFYSSLGKPPQGSDIDCFWFDEEIFDEQWFPEMSARILDRHGRGIWSATPQAGTEQLFELHERAEKEETEKDPSVQEFVILLDDNPHISAKAKREFTANLSDEEINVRIKGEFIFSSYKVYPEFSMQTHGVPWQEIPRHWTRYMVVDPGHQVCAVLFAAVPPLIEGDHVWLYDELYLKDCNAAKFAENVSQKATGQRFQSFLVDPHMAVHTELGVGKNVAEQYADALREVGVKSYSTGHHFVLASDDVMGGVMMVHDWLRSRPDRGPKLKVLEGTLPMFEWEIKRYHRKKEAGLVVDKPNQRRNNHLMDCLRYLALYHPMYVRPPDGKAPGRGAINVYREKKKRRQEDEGGAYVRLGPGKK